MKVIGLLLSGVLLSGCFYFDVDVPDGGLIQVPQPIQTWFRNTNQEAQNGGYTVPYEYDDVPYWDSWSDDADAGVD